MGKNLEPLQLLVPGEPVAAGRPRFNRKTGKAYSPSSNVEYMDLVQLVAKRAVKRRRLPLYERGQPLALSATFYFPYRSQDYGTGRNAGLVKKGAPVYCIGQRDLDNLLKLVVDGLQRAGVIWNDAQIVRYGIVEKKYAEIPQTVVRIEPILADAPLSVLAGGRTSPPETDAAPQGDRAS